MPGGHWIRIPSTDWYRTAASMNENYDPRSMTERLMLAGADLKDYVKRLIAEGNARRLIVRKPDGEPLMEIPLTAAVAVGAVLTLLFPVFAAIGAIAALVTKMQVDIERVPRDDERDRLP